MVHFSGPLELHKIYPAQKQWKTQGFRHIGQRRVALRCGEYLLNRRKLFWLQKNSFFLKNYEFRSWLEPQPHLGFLGRSEPETLNRPERLFNSSKTVENMAFCTLSLFDSDEMSTLRRLRKKLNFASRSSHSTIFAVRPPVQYSARKNRLCVRLSAHLRALQQLKHSGKRRVSGTFAPTGRLPLSLFASKQLHR